MSRGWMFVLALSVGLNLGLIVRECSTPRGGPDHGRDRAGRERPTADEIVARRMNDLKGRLDLTPDQETALRSILTGTIPRVMARSDSVHVLRTRLVAAYGDSVLDPVRVRELAEAMNAAQAGVDSVISESLLREAAVLTPEQRKIYTGMLPWGRHRRH